MMESFDNLHLIRISNNKINTNWFSVMITGEIQDKKWRMELTSPLMNKKKI